MFLGVNGMGRSLNHAVSRFANAIACSAVIFEPVPKDAEHISARMTLKSVKALKTCP